MITIIAAVSDNGVIGRDGGIPWKLKDDMADFVTKTKGHTVIMGRKTYESIIRELGKPLPNRTSIVISSTLPEESSGITVACSWEEALRKAPRDKDIFVTGGSAVYQAALPVADALSLTRVCVVCEGDTHFPNYNKEEWEMESTRVFKQSERNEYSFSIQEFKRKKKPSFVNLAHARSDEQRVLMEQIAQEGACPFCRENFYRHHPVRPITEHRYWMITKNAFPYEGAREHWLIIPLKHVERVQDLEREAWTHLWDEIATIEQNAGLPGATVFIRSGDSDYTGGSVPHLHVHLVFGSTDREHGEPIRVRIGYKPTTPPSP